MGSGTTVLGSRQVCMLKAGRFVKTCLVKLDWGEMGRDWVRKGFINHTKEFGPYVEGSGEHIHSGMNKLCLHSLYI